MTLSPTTALPTTSAPTASPTMEIFCDDMTILSDQWILSDSKHLSKRKSSKCSRPDNNCYKIEGYYGEDCYMRRSESNLYATYTLNFDIVLSFSMEPDDYCRIKYSFDGDTFTELQSYQGSSTLVRKLDQSFSFDSSIGDQVWIQFENDGNDPNGYDSCYFDNICLYGQGIPDTAHPTKSPTYPTISPTTTSPTTHSPTQSPLNLTFIDGLISPLPLSAFSWSDINSGTSECTDPSTTGWCSKNTNNPNSYLQVDLGHKFAVDSVSTWGIQCGCPAYGLVTLYNLTYATDVNVYKPYIHNPLQGNVNPQFVQKNVLSPYIVAQYLRFTPVAFFRWKSLRVDASGYSYVFMCTLF